jgi:hypothetical protein
MFYYFGNYFSVLGRSVDYSRNTIVIQFVSAHETQNVESQFLRNNSYHNVFVQNTPAYSSAAAAEIEAQKKVRIGCCNGLPYTNNKRCCCRRAAFDKDSKFCCAINVRSSLLLLSLCSNIRGGSQTKMIQF